MKMRIQVIIEDESGLTTTAEIAAIERRLSTDLIGISLEEAKAMTGSVQRVMVEIQAREAIDRGSRCPECQLRLRRNGLHRIRYRTPFGRLDLHSPRFYRCLCGSSGRQSISPLALWLGDHTSPELQYLEAQFAALLSYGASARILSAVLPLENATSITTWKRHVTRVGGRLDEEAHHRLTSQPALNEFGLPTRNPLRAVGIDGGYVKASDAPSRQEGWFEVMVGKSLPRAGRGQVFTFVHRLEPKPNARMERFLAEQGVFPAQPTTFLSDGGETVRQAQGEFRDFGEPILDWFHVAMRTTQLTQSIKGLAADLPIEGDSPNRIEDLLRELNRAKAYLWHGSPHRALRTLEDLTWEIGTESPRAEALQDKLDEFMNYITANIAAISSVPTLKGTTRLSY
ncbi:MAG: ISKra4 family transposase [Steroidobacteraceae bacterium]